LAVICLPHLVATSIFARKVANADPERLTRTPYHAIYSYSVRNLSHQQYGLKVKYFGRASARTPPGQKMLIGGLIIMNENGLKLTIVNPQNLYDPSPNGYSTAVITPRAGRVAYISGQGGQDSMGALSPDFAVQVAQAYANLRTALDALGAKPDQVAKLTVFVVDHDMSKLEVLTRNVKDMFGEALPAQTLIPVPKLAIDPMLFEVEAVVILE
jgi:enamine deaminase RidA (YjgF/YER057c/UK114 family)